jgi:hypothetical protein
MRTIDLRMISLKSPYAELSCCEGSVPSSPSDDGPFELDNEDVCSLLVAPGQRTNARLSISPISVHHVQAIPDCA